MKHLYATAVVMVFAMSAAPALAGWKLIEKGAEVTVAKSKLMVKPGERWSRLSARPIKKGEIWTLDGPALNEVYFVAGLVPLDTLYRDVRKKDNPLPKMRADLLTTEIPEFFESSTRIALATSMFQITGTEPAKLSGHDGVKFTYEYSVAGSSLPRKGVALGVIVANQLYLISYTAPSLYYFDRDRPKIEAIFASARF